jgi:GxxExxY protein
VTELLYKDLAFSVIGAAMEVRRVLGPGYPESVYQAALERELAIQEIPLCLNGASRLSIKLSSLQITISIWWSMQKLWSN